MHFIKFNHLFGLPNCLFLRNMEALRQNFIDITLCSQELYILVHQDGDLLTRHGKEGFILIVEICIPVPYTIYYVPYYKNIASV